MKKIIIIALLSLFISSCENFLSPESPNEYKPKTVESLKELLVGTAYPSLNQSLWSNTFTIDDYFSDDIEMSNDPKLSPGGRVDAYEKLKISYCMNPDMYELGFNHDTYTECYKGILGCNVVLKLIDEVSGSVEKKSYVLAEAYLLRAFYYFYLVNIYGEPYSVFPEAPGVPIKTKADLEQDFKKRSSVKEIYDFVVSDLAEAEKCYMAADPSRRKTTINMPSLPLLYLLRSRVALYMEDWQTAADYSEKVIHSEWGFSLYDLNSFVPDPKKKRYPSFTNLDTPNPETIYVYGISSATTKLTGEWGYISAGEENDRRFLKAAPELMNSYDDDDLRKKYYSVLEYAKKELPGSYLPYSKVNIGSTNAIESDSKSFGRMVRLSEAYLNYAEACSKLNKPNEAIAAIEEIRRNRYVKNSPNVAVPKLTGEQLTEYIRTERRKELCFEGHRWFDQRRCGMKPFTRKWYELGTLTHVIQINEKDAAFTMKLPINVLEQNPNLVQNRTWEKKY